ncbi:MAG: hypothetical protein ACT4PK_05335 [Gammaproteobacteria bacterium]
MDIGIIALIVIAAIVGGAAFFARPRNVLPLEELLMRLHSIQNDAQLTAAQKLHLAEIAYRGFEANTLSVIGGVHDVFPAASIVMKTSSRSLPLIGVELSRVSPEELRAFDKGKAVTLRVRLPGWAHYSDIVGLPAGFKDARLFYAGRWYGVKSTYRVRDPNEPRTGEYPLDQKPVMKTGEHKVLKSTGEFKALPRGPGPKTGEYRVANPGPRTLEVKIGRPDDPKRGQ